MRNRGIYRTFFIAFFLLMFALVGGQFVMLRVFAPEVTVLDSGWDVTRLNQVTKETVTFKNVNPERLRALGEEMRAIGPDDRISMRRTLDEMADVVYPALFIDTRNAAAEIYLDGVRIASAYMDAYEAGEFIGGGDFFVDLPLETKGRELEIVYYPSRAYAFFNVTAPTAGEFDDICRIITYKTIVPFIMGIFLIIYGMGMTIMMTIYVTYLWRFEAHIVTGMLCIVLGAWILTRNRLTVLVAPGLDTTLWEHASLYLVIPMLYVYLTEMPRFGNPKRFYFIAGISSLLCGLFIFFGVTKAVPITYFQIPFHVLSFVGTVLVFYYLYRIFQAGEIDSSEGVRITGIAGMSVTALVTIVARNIADYAGIFHSVILPDIFPIGAGFFMMTQMIDYFIYVTGYYAKKEENTTLLDIAYVDELTGLANRAEWDRRMSELDERASDYCILSMDLNGLKEVNDSLGHPEGDRLLQRFAVVLKDSSRDSDFVARIGGDEFVVIAEDTPSRQIDTFVKYMERNLRDLDRAERGINHSCACGYAFKQEAEDAHAVYLLADHRMYEHKAAQKEQMGV